ncbi:fluoride efflux transporter CrcB [Stenoxybacter acetivorans]|uniref:fluoride efflux transporter CrcB n=1 Tax=Stenoxybacter acetivorans TaxID=422441 RepID=UPI0005676DF3|nr:fluoride efflux transporter CrcB [Stenoxybacter acetivorans]
MYSILAIACGAVLGALLRWCLGNAFNLIHPHLPLGTLLANWIGAYLIGVIAALFNSLPVFSTEWRLFLITGFLGALTTFSSFSLESVSLLQNHRFGMAFAHIALHLGGSLLLTFLGLMTVFWVVGK